MLKRLACSSFLVMVLASVGCGDDEATPDAAAPDIDAAAVDAAAQEVSCTNYCTAVMANCTAENAQYGDMAECMSMCETAAAWDLGAVDDTDVNSVGCRQYHAGAAADDAALHCPHAGSTGGGVCGSYCANYCRVVTRNCAGGDAQYADEDECMTGCALIPDDGTPGDSGGDSVQCRIYHASAPANGDPALHCPHAGLSGGNVCGTWCDVYCQLNLLNCVGGDANYADLGECTTACGGFPDTGAANDTGGDTVQCRIYHGGIPAAGDPGLHCPHSGADGAGVCSP